MSAHIDDSELRAFAQDLAAAAGRVADAARPTMSKAGLNIKDAYAAQARGSSNPGFRSLGGTISYDLIDGGFGVEIGPDRSRGGAAGLAGFFLGWPNGGGGGGDLDGPLEAEAEVAGRYAAEALGDLLR